MNAPQWFLLKSRKSILVHGEAQLTAAHKSSFTRVEEKNSNPLHTPEKNRGKRGGEVIDSRKRGGEVIDSSTSTRSR